MARIGTCFESRQQNMFSQLKTIHSVWGFRIFHAVPMSTPMWGAAPRTRRAWLVCVAVGALAAPGHAFGRTDSGASTALAPAAPTISSVSPMSGPVGGTVTITGANFTGVDLVSFYDYPTTYTVVSENEIRANVPTGTPSPGRWRVRTPAGLAVYASLFTVTSAPTISSVSPMSGPVASTVTITGVNFTGADLVSFYDYPTTYTVISANEIRAAVPSAHRPPAAGACGRTPASPSMTRCSPSAPT